MPTSQIGVQARFRSAARRLDADLLSVDVQWGCRFDWPSGQFRLLSATGQVELTTRSGRYDGRTPPQSDYDRPVPARLLLGTDILWRGLLIARPITRLSPAPTLIWPVRAHHWQALRHSLTWAQDPDDHTCQEVVTDMITAGGAGAAATAARWPAGVRLHFAESIGSLGQTLAAAAQATGTMPVEISTGALALVTPESSGDPIARRAGQIVEDGSTIARHAVSDTRVLVLAGRTGGAPEADADIATGIIAAVADPAARRVTAVYRLGADIASVVATAPRAGNADTTITGGVRARHVTLPGGGRILALEATASAPAGKTIHVIFRGRVVREQSIVTGEIIPAGATDTTPRVHTVPWIDWAADGHTTASQVAMADLTQAPMVMARLVIPLWSDASVSPLDPAIEPGSWAIFAAGDRLVTMLVLSMRIVWALGRLPRAVLTGIVAATTGGHTPGVVAGDTTITPGPVALPGDTGDPPPAPTLTVSGPTVDIAWADNGELVDIARAPTGERTTLAAVIRSGVAGGAATDSPGPGTWDYRLRRPSGPAGPWGPWASITVTSSVLTDRDLPGAHHHTLLAWASPAALPAVTDRDLPGAHHHTLLAWAAPAALPAVTDHDLPAAHHHTLLAWAP